MSVGRSVVDGCFLVSAASLMLRAAHARNPEASSQTALRGENVLVMIFPFRSSGYECRCNGWTDPDRLLHLAGDSLHQRAARKVTETAGLTEFLRRYRRLDLRKAMHQYRIRMLALSFIDRDRGEIL
jgi:hypothetical protein